MFIYAILIWVLITLNAPVWTYVFIGISALIKILNAGVQLGKNARDQYMGNDKCCGNCNFACYDKMNGYVCCNPESEYVADFVDYEFCCDEHEEKE